MLTFTITNKKAKFLNIHASRKPKCKYNDFITL